MLKWYKDTIQKKVITFHVRLHDIKKMRKVMRTRTALDLVKSKLDVLVLFTVGLSIPYPVLFN